MPRPPITLLTDFGTADHYVAAMKGVILGICPEAPIVDISHEVRPFAIAQGAYLLSQAWEYFPKGTVHVAVVDPGVGSDRRAIVAQAAGHYFVGPDNGVLSMALKAAGAAKTREIKAAEYFRHPVSRTFHGRDIFAPAAAHLANGLDWERLGPPIEAWAQLDSEAIGVVLHVDRFGNIVTNFHRDKVGWVAERPFSLTISGQTVTRWCEKYSEAKPGELFALWGSGGYLEISLSCGNAATVLRVEPGRAISSCA